MPDQTDALIQGVLQPQQSGVLDKISNVFGHPLVQAALGTYLGAITTPRYEGLSGAIGRGGLMGLQDFAQARQLQAQMPLLRAKTASSIMDLPLKKEEIAEKGAHATLLKAQTGQYLPPEPEFAQQLAIDAQNEKDPNLALAKQMLSMGLSKGGMKSADAAKTLMLGATQGSKVALQQAQMQLAQTTGQLREQQIATEKLKPGLIGAEQTRDIAQAGAAQAAATHSLASAAAEPGKAANAQITKVNTDLGRFLTANPGGDHDLQVQRATAYAQNLNPGVPPDQIKAAAEALIPATGLMTKVGETLGLVPGVEPAGKANVVTPAHGKNPTATGPNGQKIRWNGTAWVPVGGAPNTMPGTAIAGE